MLSAVQSDASCFSPIFLSPPTAISVLAFLHPILLVTIVGRHDVWGRASGLREEREGVRRRGKG
jgi:hypothetical protein